jgi:gluconolactonase
MHPKTLLALASIMGILSLIAIQYDFFISSGNNPFIQTAIVNTASHYPDNPLWKDKALYYTEYTRDRVMVRDGRGNTELWREPGCGPRALAFLSDKLLVACHDSDSLVELSAGGALTRRITADCEGAPLTGPREMARDDHGGIYLVNTVPRSGSRSPVGRIFYINSEGIVQPAGVTVNDPGGITVVPRKNSLLVSEKSENRLVKFDVKAAGVLTGKRVFIRLSEITAAPEGMDRNAGPDGLAVDSGGDLFVCHSGASRVLVIGPAGDLLQIIKTSLPNVTGLAFGRLDNVIYITAVSGFSEPPYTGAVFEYTRKRTRHATH